MADDISTWDATSVIAQAKAMIHSSNYEKVTDARKSVDDILANWVAAVEEQSDPKSAARGSIAIVALWRQYAALEMELRQFKQATKVFEKAVNCRVAGSSTALWLQYADFCVQRKKFSNARKIFVRALHTLPEREQTAVWARFYGFVCTHVDNKLSLAMLQHQVMPDKYPQPGTTPATIPIAALPVSSTSATVSVAPVAASTSLSASSDALTTIPSTLQPQQPQPAHVTSSENNAVSLVDPVVAFIDKTGEVSSTPTPMPSPLAVESVGCTVDRGDAEKRGPPDPPLAGDAKRAKQDVAVLDPTVTATASTGEPVAYFMHIPMTLPFTPSCPQLLFDSMADGETQKQIENELLERLSDVLGDSAVFESVRGLHDNQRTRDREMLYRWQELIGMQMKEGSELFARHVALEMQHGFSDPRGLIALKTQHLEQRREFSSRCLMSQQQFIEICSMDRASALKVQQTSLESMKIPEVSVTTDPESINLQRAIVGLILEAEKLWREENQRASTEAIAASIANKKGSHASSSPSRPPMRQRRDSQDSTTSSHSTARSSSGGGGFRSSGNGRQDLRGSRNWGGNGNNRRRDRDPRGGRGRSNKWDIQPPQSGPPVAAAPPQQRSHYDYSVQHGAPNAQEQQQMPLYDRGPQRMQVPLQQQQPHQFQPQQPYGAPNAPLYDKYGGQQQGSMPEQQGYSQPSGAYFSGPQDGPCRPRDGDCFVGQEGSSRDGPASGGWPQQQQHPFHQPPMRQHSGPSADGEDFRPPFDPSLSRYGAGTGPGAASVVNVRDGPGPAPYGAVDPLQGGMPADAPHYQLPLHQQSPYHHQLPQQQPLRHNTYSAYPHDQYGPPQGEFQQHGGIRPMENYGSAQQQPPQEMMQRQQPPQRYQADHLLPAAAPGMSNRRNRRGGRYRR
ncbi:unnamed protein product [Peronospora belbahrii]|uniref:Pre-mRNA-splicing factor Syf1-like N-terminal HAT-repeats domain-containing protein n=1 Tax=Peronospora belbahrii TaxID=622444 RepID=A0ABN8D538_9STRA|nr:unnamed protein product [Peronospora belbahrii]